LIVNKSDARKENGHDSGEIQFQSTFLDISYKL
jgi:hypothetical protein